VYAAWFVGARGGAAAYLSHFLARDYTTLNCS
jgi:hypothetical protein